MTGRKLTFAALLARAEAADPSSRIDLRDDIAAHGTVAVEAMTRWLREPALAAFAIRVISKAAANGDRESARAALRSARRHVAEHLRRDIDWALATLKET